MKRTWTHQRLYSVLALLARTVTATISCPAANSTVYVDFNNVSYDIHCSADNNYTSFDTVTIASGGFATCFGACDNATACEGFTYVGNDSGSCYLKESMPESDYSNTAGGNYISVARTNATQANGTSPTSSSSSSSSSTTSSTATSSSTASSTPTHSSSKAGVIVGAVVGGVAAILICLLAFFIFSRRRNNKIDIARKASKAKTSSEPVVEQPGNGEVFAPYGGKSLTSPFSSQNPTDMYQGFHREGLASRGRDSSAVMSSTDSTDYSKADYYMPTPARAPLDAGTKDDAKEEQGPAMLDSREMKSRPYTPTISEMADTSPTALRGHEMMSPAASISTDESPVLGRHSMSARGGRGIANETMRRKHIMSWNNYDDRSAMGMPGAMSAGLSPIPRDRPEVVKEESEDSYRPSPVHSQSGK